MNQRLAQLALVVRDYDEAINFYTKKLHFRLIEDTKLSETKRWVVVRPPGTDDAGLLLAKGVGAEQISRIGNQTGGRVFLFLYTDNFDRDFKNLIDQKITIIRQPTEEEYGKVAVFEDLWDLIQPT